MPHNPRWEDYQRSYIAYSRIMREKGHGEAQQSFPDLDDSFRDIRDKLPQTDQVRAFHLVADAAELIDLKLPIATEEQAEAIVAEAHRLLDEAVRLDEHCYDAMRMSTFAEFQIYDDTLEFLASKEAEVRAYCEECCERSCSEFGLAMRSVVTEVEMGPYLRWLATQAMVSLICGRNRQALNYAYKALDTDPSDVSDVRFTAALAYAKLEDEKGLNSLIDRQRMSPIPRAPDDAWTTIAQMCIAYKQCDRQTARTALSKLISTYPSATEILFRQTEFPDSVFARLHVRSYSADELTLAVSESTILFQECMDYDETGAISGWIRNEIAQRVSRSELARLNRLTFPDYYGEDDGPISIDDLEGLL